MHYTVHVHMSKVGFLLAACKLCSYMKILKLSFLASLRQTDMCFGYKQMCNIQFG